MKISRYSLPFHSQNVEGVLIEEDGAYASLQAWTPLGDLPLDTYLEDLKKTKKLPLTQRALQILEIEKNAKKENISLLPRHLPASHLLLEVEEESLTRISQEISNGIQYFKFKIGNDQAAELAFFKNVEKLLEEIPFHLRLDANLKFNKVEAYKFFSHLSEDLLCALDFVEDPFSGTEKEWEAFHNDFDIRIAHDFAPQSFRDVADVWVLKPSREDPWPWVERATHQLKRIVVTSALDHPLAYVVAAWEASRIQQLHPLLIDTCGLLPYEKEGTITFPFHRKGNVLDFSALHGSAFGMDSFLKTQKWEAL